MSECQGNILLLILEIGEGGGYWWVNLFNVKRFLSFGGEDAEMIYLPLAFKEVHGILDGYIGRKYSVPLAQVVKNENL